VMMMIGSDCDEIEVGVEGGGCQACICCGGCAVGVSGGVFDVLMK